MTATPEPSLLKAAGARHAVSAGQSTCESLARLFLERAAGDGLNAFISIGEERAIGQARAVDRKLADGTPQPLAGLVVAVKDTIAVRGERLTCGSRMLSDFVSLYDATVVERLEAAGAVVIGKTNCDEFAMGSSNETSFFGRTLHPEQPHLVPGGSSGGSAAAVAAGLCHAALGSDTGGSIRQPASFCGIVGLKPTYGAVSRYGLVAFGSSLDCIGPLATDVDTARAIFGIISGRDPRDATSVKAPPVDLAPDELASNATVSGRPMRVGIPEQYFGAGLHAEVRDRVDRVISSLRDSHIDVVPSSLPHTEYGVAAYYIICCAEASSNLSRYDGIRFGYRPAESDDLFDLYARSRTEGFGAEVKRRILLGTFVLSAGYVDRYYERARRVRSRIRQDFDRAFEAVDVLLSPVAPTTAYPAGSRSTDPLQMYLEDVYTVGASLAGLPALSVPAGRTAGGAPVGVQLIGPPHAENRLFGLGETIQASLKAGV